MSRPTRGLFFGLPIQDYHLLWRVVPDAFGYVRTATGLVRVRSPLLTESRLISFPLATEMFQFARFASAPYVFRYGYRTRGGFPHSDILGSKIAPISPRLFAGCHVLRRLPVPRHPPDALFILESPCAEINPHTEHSITHCDDGFSKRGTHHTRSTRPMSLLASLQCLIARRHQGVPHEGEGP